MIKRYPVLSFYILAFALSWLGWAPHVASSRGVVFFEHPVFGLSYFLAGVGPALAAVVVAGAVDGDKGRWELLTPLWRWRVGVIWYLAALLGPVLLFAIATIVDAARAGAFVGMKAVSPWYGAFPALLTNLLLNVWEEIGWRGFALPRLQSRYRALGAALIVGLLWGLWHLPLFWITGHPFSREPFAPWLVGIVAESVLYTWLYNHAKGSLLIVSLFHAAINTVGGLAYAGSYLGVTVAACLIAIALLIASRASLGLAQYEGAKLENNA